VPCTAQRASSDDNEVTLVTREGDRHVPKAPKEAIAAEVLDEVERLLRANGATASRT
jgi:phosphopantothenoylcysteine synthetase/decarboxylase